MTKIVDEIKIYVEIYRETWNKIDCTQNIYVEIYRETWNKIDCTQNICKILFANVSSKTS